MTPVFVMGAHWSRDTAATSTASRGAHVGVDRPLAFPIALTQHRALASGGESW